MRASPGSVDGQVKKCHNSRLIVGHAWALVMQAWVDGRRVTRFPAMTAVTGTWPVAKGTPSCDIPLHRDIAMHSSLPLLVRYAAVVDTNCRAEIDTALGSLGLPKGISLTSPLLDDPTLLNTWSPLFDKEYSTGNVYNAFNRVSPSAACCFAVCQYNAQICTCLYSNDDLKSTVRRRLYSTATTAYKVPCKFASEQWAGGWGGGVGLLRGQVWIGTRPLRTLSQPLAVALRHTQSSCSHPRCCTCLRPLTGAQAC
ncbi:hypothetical protein HaLaN_28968 [Haematococcus lacustris]|uniref:Uncharacterized protein n=1 Tax=Haematococcus lacustris TaxID=44745 RepID=A0A6A0ABH1_HAELA|nr:hypothetical protein HaLaN_28968 [Haematococcus lacustris]